MRIWNLAVPGELVSFDHGASVSGVAVSPNGELVAAAAGDVRIWSTSTRQEVGRQETLQVVPLADPQE